MRFAAYLRLCALGLAIALPLAGCNKIEARSELKKANSLYKQEKYREALTAFQRGMQLDPSFKEGWRSIGLTAMALFRPGDDSAENMQYAKVAADAFKKYIELHPTGSQRGKVEEYLITTYINAENYTEAMGFLKAKQAKAPTDPTIDQAIVNLLVKQKQIEEALAWADNHASRNNPEVYYTIAVNAWDRSYRGKDLPPEERSKWTEIGLKTIDKAVKLKPDYAEAMVYYGLLIREKMKLLPEDDPQVQELFAQAESWRTKAMELRKKAAEAEEKKNAEAAKK